MTKAETASVTVRRLNSVGESEVAQLANVLIDCVEGGASVSFMQPMTYEKASAFWRGLGSDVVSGARILLVAEDADGILGTVQLVLAQPENQPHRADISKMLVHRRGRHRGVGSTLMREAEASARQHDRTLLVLDTASPEAERIYQRLGWIKAGTVPDYALLPQGGLCDTHFYYRSLT